MSVRPGDTLKVMVSCETGAASYRAELVRLICGDDSPSGPGYKERVVEHPANGTYPGRWQPIQAGSYVLVPSGPLLQSLASFTLQALIWPTTPERGTQTLLGRWDATQQAGYALTIDEGGALALRLGDGDESEVFSMGAALDARAWQLVSASYDAETRAVRVLQQPLRERARDRSAATLETVAMLAPRAPTQTPFLMAAHVAGDRAGTLVTGGHYNGKIEAPRLARRALATDEAGEPVASWDF